MGSGGEAEKLGLLSQGSADQQFQPQAEAELWVMTLFYHSGPNFFQVGLAHQIHSS